MKWNNIGYYSLIETCIQSLPVPLISPQATIVPNDVHAKLLFRGACCLYPLGENTAAMTALLEAQKLAPNDKSIPAA